MDAYLRLALAALTLGGCTGSIGGSEVRPPSRGGGGAGPGPMTMTMPMPGPDMPGPVQYPAGALRRLTVQQYANSVRDLLGADVMVPPVEADPSSDDVFVLTSVAVSSVAASPAAIDQYDAAGWALARQALDPARRAAFLGCTPASAADPCVRTFLASFGRRAWRRPLSDEEVARYATAVATVARDADVFAGLQMATAALLASPNFLYRFELAAGTGRHALDDHALATRLSYALWDTTPDAALLDAADRGSLTGDGAVLRAQVQRLLASPRARRPLLTFFSELLGTNGLDKNGFAKDTTAFPAATPALARGMYREIEGIVDDLVFSRDADLLSIFDTRQTFLTAELAKLYGLPAGAVPAGENPSPYTLPDGPRGGFLTTGAFLSLNARASITSPTLRGIFLRERLLCQEVPLPPDNVDTTLPPPPPGMVETMRQRLSRHMKDPSCAGCHRFMDPLGLALENFDALGAFRDSDGGQPLDASGDLDGQPFDGPAALAGLVRKHPATAQCLIDHLLQYLTGSGDEKATGSLAAAFAPGWTQAGGRLKGFLTGLLEDERSRTVEAAP